ncbi:unnamed protein product [Schistosoma margrebowiei]|uniref:Uncharacterized protein n=1 Tax=Schistosoma margrebowiei TaxID=48269 RepID=A0A183LEQ9_9TREM|nr:unnamed protein product [Schistosoma margrebowiei]
MAHFLLETRDQLDYMQKKSNESVGTPEFVLSNPKKSSNKSLHNPMEETAQACRVKQKLNPKFSRSKQVYISLLLLIPRRVQLSRKSMVEFVNKKDNGAEASNDINFFVFMVSKGMERIINESKAVPCIDYRISLGWTL